MPRIPPQIKTMSNARSCNPAKQLRQKKLYLVEIWSNTCWASIVADAGATRRPIDEELGDESSSPLILEESIDRSAAACYGGCVVRVGSTRSAAAGRRRWMLRLEGTRDGGRRGGVVERRKKRKEK